MGRRVTSLTRMPNADCRACHGLGSIHMTVHFYSGDQDWEAQCWECYGSDVKLTPPHPRTTDN
jgi:DnaJ-class molecular chaperone